MRKALRINIALIILLSTVFAFGQKTKKVDWQNPRENKTATFYDVQKAFNKFQKEQKREIKRDLRKGIVRDQEESEGISTYKRWENYMTPRVYPSGDMNLPSTTYGNYMEWLQQNKSLKSASATASSANWTSLGPVAVPAGYDAGVGRVDFVRFDPNFATTNTLYVGTPDGGLWKSTTGGTSWTTNTDFLTVIGVADLAIAPNGTTMYLATGSWEADKASIGMWKSTDGGSTWAPTGLTWNATDQNHIRKLIMDPSDPLIMLIATDVGLYRTTDGWASFTRLDADENNYIPAIFDIKFKPGDPTTVYAIGKDFWKSTNTGATWTKITSAVLPTTDVLRSVLGVTAKNADYVYVLSGNDAGGYKGLYRSTDSGVTFTLMSDSPNILNSEGVGVGADPNKAGGQAGHDLAIAVSPTDAEKVTIGGISQWRSLDGGTSWTMFTYWYGLDSHFPDNGEGTKPYIHADVQSITYLPGSDQIMFTTSDGGINKTIDDGVHWTDISAGLSVAQQTSIASSQTDAGYMITGLQDIGTLKKDAGTWTVINGGDGEDALIRRGNEDYTITSNPAGSFALSVVRGANKTNLTGLPADGEWLSPIHQDPSNEALIYAGGWPALYKTELLWSDGADAVWTALGTPTGSGNIVRFEIAPSSPSTIYAIKIDKISKSIDAGLTWTNITGTLPVGSNSLTNLAVSNTDPNKIWVTFSGYNAANKVFKSVDGGTNWTNTNSTGLPNLPINTIVFTNDNPNDAIYVGADIGVFYMDNTTAWTAFNTDLPNTHITDLDIYYPTSKLRASTYGRGGWESALYSVAVSLTTWTGTTSTDWNIATNWSAGVPVATTDVIIPVGTPNYPTLTAAGVCSNFTLKSNASGTASIIGNENLTVGGTTTIERYVAAYTSATKGWHLVSSPVANQPISGTWTPGASIYDFFAFDESKTTEYWLNQKVAANNLTNFVPGKGYLVAYQVAGTKTFTGALNSANVSITGLVNTDAVAYPGWQLVGNPFASAINWSTGTWTKTNIDAVAQVWDDAAASYKTTTDKSDIIPAMNGFMVHTTGSGVLTIPADARVHNSTNWYKSSDEEFILLKANDIQGATSQSSIVRFNPQSTDTYDNDYDSYFLPGFAPKFYSKSGTESYALNTLPEMSNSLVIPFGFVKNGSSQFNIELARSVAGAVVYLTDKKTNIVTNLSETPVYAFTAVAGDDNNRFLLSFVSTTDVKPDNSSRLQIYVENKMLYINQANTQKGEITIYNTSGQSLRKLQLEVSASQSVSLQNFAPGVYVVAVQTDKGFYNQKVVVK